MKITYKNQSTQVPPKFKRVLEAALRDIMPTKVEVFDVPVFVESKFDALQAALDRDYPGAAARATINSTSLVFSIDVSVGDTGYAIVSFPITAEGGAPYIGGVSP